MRHARTGEGGGVGLEPSAMLGTGAMDLFCEGVDDTASATKRGEPAVIREPIRPSMTGSALLVVGLFLMKGEGTNTA